MRTVVSWAWFRPSKKAWDKGARWYRCDVVGGGEESQQFVALPESAKGLLLGRPKDRWMVCATGALGRRATARSPAARSTPGVRSPPSRSASTPRTPTRVTVSWR